MDNRLEIGWSKEIIDLYLCDMVKGIYRSGQEAGPKTWNLSEGYRDSWVAERPKLRTLRESYFSLFLF